MGIYMSAVDVSSKFYTQPMTEEQLELSKEIRADFAALGRKLHFSLPKSRHAALAQTHLETSCMFAIKAVCHAINPQEWFEDQ